MHHPILPQTLTRSMQVCSALLVAFIPATQALILPDGVTVSVPAGSNNPANPGSSNPYTDDILLDSMTFDGVTFSVSNNQIRTIQSTYVASGRAATNAEWGDDDDNSDGNNNPFDRVSLNPDNQESTGLEIQDLALASAFSSLSLSELADGEGNGSISVTNLIFSNGIVDNDNMVDQVPEIAFFERGNNDTTTVRAITGGTFDNPTLSGAVSIAANDMWNTGLHIDTTEITGGQELAAVGIDLNEFGISDGTIVYGIQIETDGGDFGGFFQTTDDPETQLSNDVPGELNNPVGTVPEASSWGLVAGLAAMAACLRRRKRN